MDELAFDLLHRVSDEPSQWPDASPAPMVLEMVPFRVVSEDGLSILHTDARPYLDAASDESIQLLMDEWLVGSGPGAQRLLEGHSKETQGFLNYMVMLRMGWTLRIDREPFEQWVVAKRHYLLEAMDTEMISG